ncbi:MAG: hypothetical protein JWO12_2795 [Frankiales bacterium]|nr:hypothetical protein [Frankiales bacterium]
MIKAFVTAGVAASVLAVAAPATAATDSCGALPASVQGNPNVQAGQTGALYLFHDGNGWNLRVTHPAGSRMVVAGTITATKEISHLTRLHLEKGDAVAISKDGHTLTFRFTNVGHLDGVRFTAECSHALKANVKVDGKGASTTQVFLGARRVHPTSVPFAIERH